MSRRHRGRHPPHPPPLSLPCRPAPWAPALGLPEAASRDCCPCNPSGLPGGAAGRSGGDHRRRSQPPAPAADWEVSPEGGQRGAGDPGEKGSRALNPPEGCRSKTLVQRPRRCGWGRGLAGAEAFSLLCGLGLPGRGPQAANPGGRGSRCAARWGPQARGKIAQAPPQGLHGTAPALGVEGRVFVPTTPENKTRMPDT